MKTTHIIKPVYIGDSKCFIIRKRERDLDMDALYKITIEDNNGGE